MAPNGSRGMIYFSLGSRVDSMNTKIRKTIYKRLNIIDISIN